MSEAADMPNPSGQEVRWSHNLAVLQAFEDRTDGLGDDDADAVLDALDQARAGR